MNKSTQAEDLRKHPEKTASADGPSESKEVKVLAPTLPTDMVKTEMSSRVSRFVGLVSDCRYFLQKCTIPTLEG